LFFLADELRNEGHRVDVILGARSARYLLNAIEVRRLASVCRITTEDASMGDGGRVTDVLTETMDKCETEIVYTCGPDPMLASVTQIATEAKVPVQVAVEELMGCGYGVCMTCVKPLRARRRAKGDAGEEIVFARSCTEGPVFNGASVVWNGGGGGIESEPMMGDETELTPGGTPRRPSAILEPAGEHAPPGN